jgi:hypothetical protein
MPWTVDQAASLKEGLDGLLVVDDCERACPVCAPQAAVETPGIEHAGERVPDVREGIRFPGQRAGAADLDHRVRAPSEFQHLRQVGPGLHALPVEPWMKVPGSGFVGYGPLGPARHARRTICSTV